MSDVVEFKNPFPGPRPYRAADRSLFFGRNGPLKKLANQLLARPATTLFGPLGAGKSSLMQCGVIPHLQAVHDFRVVRIDAWPRNESPLSWLVQTMHAELDLGRPSVDKLASIPQLAKSAHQALEDALTIAERRSDQPILLCLDQFEQLLFSERSEIDTEALFNGLDWLVRSPLQGLQVVVVLREDYLGRFQDRARDRKELMTHGFRLGHLTVEEMAKVVCQAASMGSPSQTWDEEQILKLIQEVRVPGQTASDNAEIRAARAQIICRALFCQRHQGESTEGEIHAEEILQKYLDSTLRDLGDLADDARRLLEDQFVQEEGGRALRSESELRQWLPAEKLDPILKALEDAAILQGEARQGSRYFEIGHDWLAGKIHEERQVRAREGEQHRQQREQDALRIQQAQLRKYATIAFVSVATAAGAVGLGVFTRIQQTNAEHAGRLADRARKKAETAEENAKRIALEATDARLMAGFRELKNAGQLGWGTKLLAEVQEPNETPGWIALASEALGSNALQVTLRGHEKALRAAVWSPDGKRVLTAAIDGTARVWNATGTGAPVALIGHDKPLTTAAWSADGVHVVTGSEDGTVRIWNADGTDKPVIVRHSRPIVAAVFDPLGKQLLIATTGNDVFVGTGDGTGFVRFSGHTSSITSATFFPDGRRFVTTSTDGTARVWNIDEPSHAVVLRGHRDEVSFAAPSPDGTKVVTVSRDATACVWDASNNESPLVVLSGHERSVLHAAWSADGTRIATASADGTARVWAADGKGETIVLSGHTAAVKFVSWRPDGRYVATASQDHSARIWPAEGGEAFPLVGHESSVVSVVWNSDGSRLLTAASDENGGSLDSTARVWHPERLESLPRQRRAFFHSASIDPKGEFIVAAQDDLSVRLLRLDGTGQTLVWKDQTDWITSAMVSPDGAKIVTTCVDKIARIVRRDGTGEAVVLSGAEAALRWAAWSPDGERIVTTSDDKRARVHRADGTGDVVTLSGHTDTVVFAAWSPDGKRIVTTSSDQTARVWNANGQGEAMVLAGHEGPVIAAAWSADGARIVTASEDACAQIFETQRGIVQTNLRHDSPVVAVAFAPDGKTIATSTRKGGLHLWSTVDNREPIVIATSSPLLALMFLDEGKRILTVGTDNTTRTFTIATDLLKQGLAESNHDCLPAEMRVIYLGESADKARQRHIECEHVHGRIAPHQERQTP